MESAIDDMTKALHYRPKSLTCINELVELLLEKNRPSEAYRIVSHSLKVNSSKLSVSKIKRLQQLQAQLVSKLTESESEPAVESEKTHHLHVDSRLEMVRNEHNRRFYFCATAPIGAEEELIIEEPSLFLLKRDGLPLYCTSCYRPCANTFWPCPGCTEVIFCSESCLQTALKGEHRLECGIAELLQSEVSSKTAQTYRLLTRCGIGHLLETATVSTYPPKEYFSRAKFTDEHSREEVSHWFHMAQCDLRAQVKHRNPVRNSSELAGAIFVYAMYCHKSEPLDESAKGEEQVSQLISTLAQDIAKVTLNEFGWHETVDQERQSIAAFQCLVGSNISHACEENATWVFYQGRLVVKAKVDIEAGQTVSISYGSFGNRSFYRRQEQVQAFTVACHCHKCAREVHKHFALRCSHCPGPVPYEMTKEDNAKTTLICMRCERPYEKVKKAKEVAGKFSATQRLLWLVQATMNDDEETIAQKEYIEEISKRMDQLAGYVDPNNEVWQGMIADLCELFCARKSFERVVSWLHWLATRFTIYLHCHLTLDAFEQLHQLDLWTTAYTAYLSKAADELLEETLAKHVSIGETFFKKTFAVLEKISHRSDIDSLVRDRPSLIKSLYKAVQDKWQQFADLTQSDMSVPDVNTELLLELSDDLQFLATVDEAASKKGVETNTLDDEAANKELAQCQPLTDNKEGIDSSGEDNSAEVGTEK